MSLLYEEFKTSCMVACWLHRDKLKKCSSYSAVSVDDILSTLSSALGVIPPTNGRYTLANGPGSRNLYIGSRLLASFNISMCFPTGFIVLAQMAPEAAALGVPIPGKQLSPHRRRPSTGVLKLGKGNGMMFSKSPA
jgi:hypothetical protein